MVSVPRPHAPTQPRAALYVRSATTSQSPDADPLAEQERACRAHATALGYAVEDRHVFREVAPGLRLAGRPDLDALRAAVRRGEVAVVVTARHDCLSRDPAQVRRLLREMEQAGVRIVCLQGGALWLG
jgi:DNA invertase Pin-like site-specific DNA recombinase